MKSREIRFVVFENKLLQGSPDKCLGRELRVTLVLVQVLVLVLCHEGLMSQLELIIVMA